MEMRPPPPLTSFLTDTHGEPALGWGPAPASAGQTEFDVRDAQTHEWRKVGTFSGTLKPVALCAAPLNCAYALGDSDGHTALWRIDLSGNDKPVVEFAQPAADLGTPLLARDGHLLGVRYDSPEPMVYYTDSTAANIVDHLKAALPG